MANKKLKNSLKKFSGQKEEKLITITGELGIPLGGQKIVDVPNRNGFVYVRLKSNTSEVIQAYNSEVSTIYGLPVLVARQGNIYKVIGRNLDRYRDWSDIPYLPKHGGQHSFNFGLGMGADVSWIYSQQFMPLLSYPSGTQGSMSLALEPHFYEWNGQWRYAQNTGTPSYTPYLPTITGSARMVLSYIDPSDNSIKLVPGTPFSNSLTGSAQIAQYIPDIPRSVGLPLAAVRLVTGTTAIGWGNIYDMRDFYTVSPGITGSTFGGIAVQDEGIPLGTGTTFNFVGANIDATISGSVIRIFVTGSAAGSANPPITGSVVYQDDYSTIGSALVFNFRNGITASASGTNAQIDVDFGTGTNQALRGSTTPYDIGATPNNGWSQSNETWTYYSRTQAYTNDPAAGTGITLNMADTTDFVVGSDVTVSSSAGSENTYVTAVVANTSITVNQLTLNHTTSSPLVTLLDSFTIAGDVTSIIQKGAKVKFTQTTVKYGTVYSSTLTGGNTRIILIHNTDYTLTNAAISNTYFSYLEAPAGWPGWFNFDPAPLGWSVLPSTSLDYKYFPSGKLMYVLISQAGNAGTSNATTTTFSAPTIANATSGVANTTTVDNGAILTTAARTTISSGARTILARSDMSLGAWTAANGKRIVTLLPMEY